MPGAVVVALNVDTGVSTKEVANNSGVYLFPGLPPGNYRVSAEKPGFRKIVMSDNILRVGDKITLNLALEVGSATESVVVEANAEAVNTLTASQGGLLNRSEERR